jgi:hypothetical protein
MSPELARSGWLDTMARNSLRKMGRDSARKSAYMGKKRGFGWFRGWFRG